MPDIQPVPLINRIHPIRNPERLSIKSSEVPLNRHTYLNLSLKDLKMTSRSFVLENYCEAQSVIYGKRRLGMVCILSGKIAS